MNAFEGIVFEGGLGDGVEVTDGEAVALRGCTFRLLGGTGTQVRGGPQAGYGMAAYRPDYHTQM